MRPLWRSAISAAGAASMSAEVLLVLAAAHSVADDVEEREHARLGAIDDAVLEILEIAPAGAAGIGDGRHADAEGVAVRVEAVIAGVRAALAGAGVDVGVDVDQAGSHVEAGDVDHFESGGRIQMGGDGGDGAILDGNIADGADVVLRIDDVSALEEQDRRRAGRRAGRMRRPSCK